MLFTLFIASIIVLLVWDYVSRKSRRERLIKSKIKSPTVYPIIGNSLEFKGLTPEDFDVFFNRQINRFGKTFHMWVFQQAVVVFTDPRDFEVIMNSQELITKSDIYDKLRVWLGDGLLMSTGKKWHIRRKIITPTFHFKILEHFVEVFDKQSSVLAEKFEKIADGCTAIDVYPLVCLAALDIISETAMGVMLKAQESPDNDYVNAVRIVTDIMSARVRRPVWRVNWMFRLLARSEYKRMMKYIKVMQDYTNDIIRKRRIALQNSASKNQARKSSDDNDVGLKKRLAFLDVLLEAKVDGMPLSDEDIREEVETFLFEGHDTTTSGISFALYLISRHPEVQQKIYNEIQTIIGDDKNAPITLRQLQDLKYLECVIKESLRLYPPVMAIGRYFKHGAEINGKVIPGNCFVQMILYKALRDPQYFKQPDEFLPERFSSENDSNIYPFAYIPFSAGPRNCIGQKFAMLEMKSAISKLLRHYELLPVANAAEPVRSITIILRSKTGLNIAFRKRA